ncbi:MAG: hypothetical protein E3J72_11330 [Planctomycetota bacterium]|nr:MAG: hypothetical protein E3J72_11330 [Planctomycetota bacterium]
MKEKISITIENQAVKLHIAGRLTGHVARNCFAILRRLIESYPSVFLDLNDCTSVDSVGVTLFEWIREQNGNVKIVPPFPSLDDSQLVAAKLASDSGRIHVDA